MNHVDEYRIGRTKPLDEDDVEEVYPAVHQPSFNPELGNSENLKQRRVPAPSYQNQATTHSKPVVTNTTFNKTPVIIILAIFALLGLTYYQLYKTKTEKVQIKNVTWEHIVKVSEYREVIRESFNVPVGGRIISTTSAIYSHNEIRHTREKCSSRLEDVPSHKEYSHTNTKVDDDGTIRKKEVYRVVTRKQIKNYCWDEIEIERVPEYRPFYTYAIMEWMSLPDLVTRGKGTTTPKFAPVNTSPTLREDGRIATYKGNFETSDRKQHEYKLDVPMYNRVKSNIGKYCDVTWSFVELKKIQC
jgi:hypothetical protein